MLGLRAVKTKRKKAFKILRYKVITLKIKYQQKKSLGTWTVYNFDFDHHLLIIRSREQGGGGGA